MFHTGLIILGFVVSFPIREIREIRGQIILHFNPHGILPEINPSCVDFSSLLFTHFSLRSGLTADDADCADRGG